MSANFLKSFFDAVLHARASSPRAAQASSAIASEIPAEFSPEESFDPQPEELLPSMPESPFDMSDESTPCDADEMAAADVAPTAKGPRGPLSKDEALEVLRYWQELELFTPPDYRGQDNERTFFCRWSPGQKTAKEEEAIDRFLSSRWVDPQVRVQLEDLRMQQGEQVEPQMPFYVVYLGIISKQRLFEHILSVLEDQRFKPVELEDPVELLYGDAIRSAMGGDDMRGDAFLGCFQLTPWGKLVEGSFKVAGLVGALNLAKRLAASIDLAKKNHAPYEQIEALLKTPAFTVETALMRNDRLIAQFSEHALQELRHVPSEANDGVGMMKSWLERETVVNGQTVKVAFERENRQVLSAKDTELVIADPQPEAETVSVAFIEHIAEGLANYIGLDAEKERLSSAVRIVMHRPDYAPRAEEGVMIDSFYLREIGSAIFSLKNAGELPCGTPGADAILSAAGLADSPIESDEAPAETSTETEAPSDASEPLSEAAEGITDLASAHADADRALVASAKATLAKVEAAGGKFHSGVLAKPIGGALARLLTHGVDQTLVRADLLSNPQALSILLDPLLLSSGRWPSDASHHLYAAQQAAVAAILCAAPDMRGRGEGEDPDQDRDNIHEADAADQSVRPPKDVVRLLQDEGLGPLISVNGPPGTGKSWLLRDVVAEVVVRRARRLAKYARSEEIFDKDESFVFAAATNQTEEVVAVRPSIMADSLIVVASNNNAAIRNITDQLPRGFTLKRFENDPETGRRTLPAFHYWRPCAVELLRRTYNVRLPDKLKNGVKNPNGAFGPTAQMTLGLNDPTGDLPDEALRDFADVWGLVSVTLGRRSNRGRFVRSVLTPSKQMQYGSSVIEQIDTDLNILSIEHKDPEDEWRAARERFLKLAEEVDERRARMKARLAAGRFTPPIFEVPLAEKPSQHKTSLWVDEDFERLRSELFLAALALHRAAVIAQAGIFKKNFRAVGRYLMLSSPSIEKGRAVRAFEAIAFLAPVISTTLASAAGMFSQVGVEELGWVLIDEASQATPMSCVGILNRAKRAVVLGDPRQLMPVVTMPERLCNYLRRRHPSVPKACSPHESSLQTLADGSMQIGAYIRDVVSDESVWTGLPLRTHRRCGSPMFEIANTVSYGGQMVQMTPRTDAGVPVSAWYDVRTSVEPEPELLRRNMALQSGSLFKEADAPHKDDGMQQPKKRALTGRRDEKVVPEELSILQEALRTLEREASRFVRDGETKYRTVFVVSPFRSVANECQKVVNALKLQRIRARADTVHAFQGQEADLVIFVLGSAPGKKGSRQRRWAASPANLLNVAVTRARKDLIVIGDYDAWTKEPTFRILANYLTRIEKSVRPSGQSSATASSEPSPF